MSYYETKLKEKSTLEGLSGYRIEKKKLKLNLNSLQMSKKYIELPTYLNDTTKKIIGENKLFCFPLDIKLL